MYSKNPLVTATDKMIKEGINDTETKPNVVKKAITPPIAKNKIDTVNETDKPQASKSKKDKSISNESDKGRSLDKSRSLDKPSSTQITETEDKLKTLDKPRSISSAIFLIKSKKMKNPEK